jgi:TetR/AcrR family transcriptional regulator
MPVWWAFSSHEIKNKSPDLDVGIFFTILTNRMVQPTGWFSKRNQYNYGNSTMADDTRTRILHAATEIFTQKGLQGARMQEIANAAGVNKAMLYYYFNSKTELYDESIGSVMGGEFADVITALTDPNLSVSERFEAFVDGYVDVISRRPQFIRLAIQDLVTGGDSLLRIIRSAQEKAGFLRGIPFIDMITEGIEQGELKQVDPVHTFMSLVGMSVIYFVGKSIFEPALGLDTSDEEALITKRKEQIKSVLLYGILAENARTTEREHA